MNDLNHGLDLLADEATPAPVVAYDVIAKAKARTRNRRATAATALATVIVAGAVIATTSPGAGPPSIQVGAPPVSPTTIPWSPPAGPTMAAEAVDDEQMTTFTEQLAKVWHSVKPQGVTTEELTWFAGGLPPLEFRGFRTTEPPDSITYAAAAALSDSQGANELMIQVIKVGPHEWPFESTDESEPDSTHTLPDGTRVDIRSKGDPAYQRTTEVLRPDGTAIRIIENSGAYVAGTSLARPDFILDTQALLRLATAISYY